VSEVSQTLTLRGLDGESLEAAMVAALVQLGYSVFKPGVTAEGMWERPSQLCRRLEIRAASLCRALAREDCPKPVRELRGVTGRLTRIVAGPELESYLLAYKEGME
jgi:hypothetical protein